MAIEQYGLRKDKPTRKVSMKIFAGGQHTRILRGIWGIVVGVIALLWPMITLTLLILMFGVYVFVDGVITLLFTLKGIEPRKRRWTGLLEGLFGIAVGLVTLFWPTVTVFILTYLIALWAILSGVFRVYLVIQHGQEMSGEWLLALSALLSTALGLFLILAPNAGVRSIVRLLGIYFLLLGISFLVSKFRKGSSQRQLVGGTATKGIKD